MKYRLSPLPLSALNRSRTIVISAAFILFVLALPALARIFGVRVKTLNVRLHL